MTANTALAPPLVQVTGLWKTFGRVPALSDVSFTIRSGELLGLIGPNGAGKTTLFECLAGVQAADAGEVRCDGVGTTSRERAATLFYVPDGIAPWPDQTVGWMLEYAVNFFGGRADMKSDLVLSLGLAPLLETRIAVLSKGQRKRALLAMGLLTPQPVLLIDEPFEGLDLRQSRDVSATLRAHAAAGRTLFVSIHQIIDAGRVCDRFVLLSGGRVCAEGTLDELTTQASGRISADAAPDFEEVFLALA